MEAAITELNRPSRNSRSEPPDGAPCARDIVVIGTSAGGIPALQHLLAALPRDMPAAVFVVQHLIENFAGNVAARVGQHSALSCHYAVDGEKIVHGRVYVAPPAHNLLVGRGIVSVSASPRESAHRPSINALFRSASESYGRRVAGVILTGYLDDGVAGLWDVKRRGGVALVQDPAEAQYPDLPSNACRAVEVDRVLPLLQLAAVLLGLATCEPPPAPLAGPRRARLLIVEDERIVAADLEDQMRGFGYEVCGNVASADAAIEAATRALPDLVLMDIRLDGARDGTRAAHAIRERLQIPVVYLTAYADDDTLDAVKRTEAYGYVMKPYEPREVHAAIQLALERREREAIR